MPVNCVMHRSRRVYLLLLNFDNNRRRNKKEKISLAFIRIFQFSYLEFLFERGVIILFREIRNRFRLIPFGKFAISGRGKNPYNEVFVGRGRERASLIESLTHQQQFGSFLISGRRGSGKTSFVEYALAEYDRSSFHRFIRFARNRSIPDALVAFALAALLSFVIVMISQLNELLAQNAAFSKLQADGAVSAIGNFSWTWAPLVLLSVPAVLFGLLAAYGVYAASRVWQSSLIRDAYLFALGVAVCLLALALAGVNLPSALEKDLHDIDLIGAKYVIAAISDGNNIGIDNAIIYFVIALISLQFANTFTKNISLLVCRNIDNKLSKIYLCVRIVFAIVLFVSILFICGKDFTLNTITDNAKLTICILISFFVNKELNNWVRVRLQKNRDNDASESFLEIIKSLSIPKLLVALLVYSVLIILEYLTDYLHMKYSLFILVLSVISFIVSFLSPLRVDFENKEKEKSNIYFTEPPVIAIILAKSILLLYFSMVLMAPLINVLLFSFEIDFEIYRSNIYNFMDGSHILPILMVLIYFFLLEYEWICRAGRTERQDFSIAPIGRRAEHEQMQGLWPTSEKRRYSEESEEASEDWLNVQDGNPLHIFDIDHPETWMRRREIARRLETATLPYLYYVVKVPVLINWINLGFDNLQHSRIIEAMLVQLRTGYRQKFISLASPVAIGGLVLTVLMVLVISKHLAATWFHVGHIDQKPAVPFEVLLTKEQLAANSTFQCHFFDDHTELAPPIKDAVCLLPSGDRLFNFLYTPVLQLGVDFTTYDKSGPNRLVITDEKCAVTRSENCGCEDWIAGNTNTACSHGFRFHSISGSFVLKYFLDVNLGLPILTKGPRKCEFVSPKSEGVCANFQASHPLRMPTLDKAPRTVEEKRVERHGFPTLRVYHLILFVLVFFTLRGLNGVLHILPYRARVAEMSRLIDLIRGRVIYTRSEAPRSGWLLRLIGFGQRDQTFETTPDPRIVEQSFIDLLNVTTGQKSGTQPTLWHMFEAKPEIVFVFDEMDKLSGKVDPELSRTDELTSVIVENTKERQRSQQLHELLSDMKRLINSDATRFIFIGGRLYHDEWLADQANRTPLLNSIFNGQIYLPSFLTDREHPYGRMNERIAEFLILTFRNAQHRFQHWRLLRHAPAFVGARKMYPPTYIQAQMPYSGHPRRFAAMARQVGMHVFDEEGERYNFQGKSACERYREAEGGSDDPRNNGKQSLPSKLTLGERETLEQFLNFLTYRSAGNPKKLKEMLLGFMLPGSKGFELARRGRGAQHRNRWHKADPHHDVIVLDDKAIYRMQFIDVLYRHLTDHLESRMLERDDKVAMSMFYLMDFLLKFHNRGFSWANLQRVDELSHIHRAPDLRSMMGELVDVSSERFLHRVLNGVYAFRFRSDFSKEIDYLSRVSMEEMAAFNFTLDESQSLKGLYQQTMHSGHRENADTISGLGELYEYDQDFEIARNYYRKAISVLDRNFTETTGNKFSLHRDRNAGKHGDEVSMEGQDDQRYSWDTGKTGPSGAAEWLPSGFIQQSEFGTEAERKQIARLVRANFPWAIARLRLMLQIGNTYEQERNYERALGSYMHSHRFSQLVVQSTLRCFEVEYASTGDARGSDNISAPEGGQMSSTTERTPSENDGVQFVSDNRNDRSILGEHYPILFQAAHAAAWVFEKDNQNVDESIAHAEHALRWIYKTNPILFRKKWDSLNRRESHFDEFNASLLLMVGDMHDRTGDILFFKGRQSMRLVKNFALYRTLIDFDCERPSRFGYLLEAHYHYAMSIWNIRNFMTLRKHVSTHRLNIMIGSKISKKPTFDDDGPAPDLIHNSIANAVTDMSEAVMARGSLGGILNRFCRYRQPTGRATNSYGNTVKFLKKFDRNMSTCTAEFSQWVMDTGQLTDDLGDKTKPVDEKAEINPPLFCKKLQVHGHTIKAGSAHLWLGNPGEWDETFDGFSDDRTLEFGQLVKEDERFFAYIFFSSLAARNYGYGGYTIDAANEYLVQVEAIIAVLWSIRSSNWLRDDPVDGDQSDDCRPGVLRKKIDEMLVGFGKKTKRKLKNSGIDCNPSDINDLKELLKNLDESGKDTSANCFATSQCTLGAFAAIALIKAAELIQISFRPSATRFKQNHGNTKTMFPDKSHSGEPWETSLSDDYALSQPWRDDPRILSLSASLILALAGETGGPGFIAQYVYQNLLRPYGAGLFNPLIDKDVKKGNDCHEHLSSAEWDNQWTRKTFDGLYRLTERYRYPVLNRMYCLKTLIDAAIFHEDAIADYEDVGCYNDWFEPLFSDEVSDEFPASEARLVRQSEHAALIGRFCSELVTTEGTYDSEIHFTPEQLGSTLAHAYFYCCRNGYWTLYETLTGDADDEKKVRAFQNQARAGADDLHCKEYWKDKPSLSAALFTREGLGEAALSHLRRSEEMFSMGKAYYENIAYLQYLNDDFNDRMVHHKHARQMLFAEMSHVLISAIEADLHKTSHSGNESDR